MAEEKKAEKSWSDLFVDFLIALIAKPETPTQWVFKIVIVGAVVTGVIIASR
jgi:uncharacterized integral membrane protein